MKRLLLVLPVLAVAFFTPRPAAADVPTLLDYFCVGATFEFDDTQTCYASMGPSFVGYAMETVYGFCTNGATPDTGGNAFWACAYETPTGNATGFGQFGYSPADIIGAVIVYIDVIGLPTNPKGKFSEDCNYTPAAAMDPITSC